MSKFKVGDKIRRIMGFNSSTDDTEYVVSSVKGPWLALDDEASRGITGHPYWANYFELVINDYLTPQEVLQCVQDDVELEFWNGLNWRTSCVIDCRVSTLLTNKYRKKPVPSTVSINSVEVPKPIDTSIVPNTKLVYSITELDRIEPHNSVWVVDNQVPVWSTREDAEAALKAIRSALGVD